MKKFVLILLTAQAMNVLAQYNWVTSGNYPSNYKPQDFALTADGTVYCLGIKTIGVTTAQNGLLTSLDDGENWGEVSGASFPSNDGPYTRMTISGNNILIARSSVYRSTDGGNNWSAANSGLPANLEHVNLLTLPNSDILCSFSKNEGSGYVPRLFKSSDNGSTWTEVAMNGIDPEHRIIRDMTYAKNKLIVSTSPIITANSGNGKIYVSSDFGLNFTFGGSITSDEKKFYGRSLFAVSQSEDVFLIGDTAIISELLLFTSPDGGLTWSRIKPTGVEYVGNASTAFIKANGPFLIGGTPLMNESGQVIKSASTVGVKEQNKIFNLQVLPNPSSGLIKIQNLNSVQISSAKVVDYLGSCAYENSEVSSEINLQHLTKGVYILLLEHDKGKEIHRIVIQ